MNKVLLKKKLDWQIQVSLVSGVGRGRPKDSTFLGLVLTQDVSSGKWSGVAAETKAKDIRSFFDSHAHHYLGEFETLELAMAAGEKYMKKWLGSSSSSIGEPCDCDEIPSGKIDAEFETG